MGPLTQTPGGSVINPSVGATPRPEFRGQETRNAIKSAESTDKARSNPHQQEGDNSDNSRVIIVDGVLVMQRCEGGVVVAQSPAVVPDDTSTNQIDVKA